MYFQIIFLRFVNYIIFFFCFFSHYFRHCFTVLQWSEDEKYPCEPEEVVTTILNNTTRARKNLIMKYCIQNQLSDPSANCCNKKTKQKIILWVLEFWQTKITIVKDVWRNRKTTIIMRWRLRPIYVRELLTYQCRNLGGSLGLETPPWPSRMYVFMCRNY